MEKKKRGRKKGYKVSEETKAKLSAINKGKESPMAGKKHTAESLKKNSEKHLGVANHMYGKEHTAATKEKLSAAMAGRPKTEEAREKIRLGNLNRRKVKSVDGLPFKSIAAAARHFNLTTPCLRARIRRGAVKVEYY